MHKIKKYELELGKLGRVWTQFVTGETAYIYGEYNKL